MTYFTMQDNMYFIDSTGCWKRLDYTTTTAGTDSTAVTWSRHSYCPICGQYHAGAGVTHPIDNTVNWRWGTDWKLQDEFDAWGRAAIEDYLEFERTSNPRLGWVCPICDAAVSPELETCPNKH